MPEPVSAVEKNIPEQKIEWILSQGTVPLENDSFQRGTSKPNVPPSAVSGGYLEKPFNIYAEESATEKESISNTPTVKESPLFMPMSDHSKEELTSSDMQLVFKEPTPAADMPGAYQTQPVSMADQPAEEPVLQDEAEDLKRRAADRISKLRNLSFNINAVDPNNEFETVPAYIRRNLELYNTVNNVENFYSNYEVKADSNNNAEISTINTFLHGKKPD